MSKERIHLGIVIVGHVDAGKSTTTGRLLFELGGLTDRELEKLKKEAKDLGRSNFMYAFSMDKSKIERTKGMTIQCCTKEFFTPTYHYTIIDAPGHKDFIKNMISGASQADVALLMVPANQGGFESSIVKGNHKKGKVQGQTRQHARLCHLLGIDQLIVGVNKMDDKSVNWSKDRFMEIKTEVEEMLNKIGYKAKKIPFIPISGYLGDNLKEESKNMDWFKGWEVKYKKKDSIKGKTLFEALDKAIKPPKRDIDKPLRMPVSGVLKIKGSGDVITGRIEQGKIKPGINVVFYPSNVKGKVFSIQMHHKNVQLAKCGDNVGVNIRGLVKGNMPKCGDLMCSDEKDADPNPPKSAKSFKALVFVQDHPGKLKAAVKDKKGQLKGGFTPSIHIRTAKAPCQMAKIAWKTSKVTNNQKVENPTYIETGDQAEVTFVPKVPICVSKFEDCKPLGRIAAMDGNSLIMLGKVIDVEYFEDNNNNKN